MIDINIDRLFYFDANDNKHIICMCLSILFQMKIFTFCFFTVHKNQNLQSISAITFVRSMKF
jgi:hypothetical protein